MPLLHFPQASLHPPLLSSKPKPKPGPVQPNRPARDRVIDFGKHRGKMLGSLPSTYLRWVSRTLRARDFQEWARLADDVLEDPVYKDRLEWESAQRILTGDGIKSASRSETPASDLLEISNRFGWDAADQDGWARIDFELLGTSHGGRIPRLAGNGETGFSGPGKAVRDPGGSRVEKMGSKGRDWGAGSERKDGILGLDGRETRYFQKNSVNLRNGDVGFSFFERNGRMGNELGSLESSNGDSSGGRLGFLRKGYRFVVQEEEGMQEEELMRSKREERREKRKIKRGQQLEMLKREVGVDGEKNKTSDGGSLTNGAVGDGEMLRREVGVDGEKNKTSGGGSLTNGAVGAGQTVNPFPGRGALLDKINRRRQGD